ncbi:MAG: hypothetical protein IT198_01025 [Acidimicrobiia bacterium]|nr:hypothetical protein [Acidimicrobiia bacterium]
MRRTRRWYLASALAATFFVTPTVVGAFERDSTVHQVGTQTPEQVQEELFELKASLDIADQRREKALADLDRVEAEIRDLEAEIEANSVEIATAESAVQANEARIGRWARQMYQRPLSQVLPFIESENLNEVVLTRYYLSRTLNRDADAMAAYEQAKQGHSDVQADLLSKKAELEQKKRDREKWRLIIDQSIAREQELSSRLQTTLSTLMSTGAVPWGALATCPQAPQTGVPGPWILEDWAVWTLKSVAMRTGIPEPQVVTREHIIALVAFAWGEGGGIQNHRGMFNPLNTNGWWRLFPELGGRPSGRGTDDWPTFDAGVEASARALTSKTQGRLGIVLTKPNTTAADFFTALASPELYAGNKNWSADDKQHVLKYASLTKRVTEDYNRYAGEVLQAQGQVVVGTPRTPTGWSIPGALSAPLTC